MKLSTSFYTPFKPVGWHQGSGAGFRRNSEAINGVLTGFLCAVSGAVGPVFGEGAGYG